MNRRCLGAGLVSMAVAACMLAAPGSAAAASGPHHTPSELLRSGPSTHRSGEPKSLPSARRSLSGHVSPYARSRAGLVDPANVESIRSYYQRETNRPAGEDAPPGATPQGAAL